MGLKQMVLSPSKVLGSAPGSCDWQYGLYTNRRVQVWVWNKWSCLRGGC